MNVDELEVVTGDGRLLRCSATRHSALFDATRAGLGQFSVISNGFIRYGPAHETRRQERGAGNRAT